MALGQGFDNFLKLHFENFQSEPIPLMFGVIEKLDFYHFRSYQKSHKDSGKRVFGINVENFFLRLFVSELTLTYDFETKQLLMYSGLSNIFTADGEKQFVEIGYEVRKP